ncbi:hypothetical protein RND71_040039 [Anisodus tanguticus]|uniref:Uncharacterized protein n=1 Tax=Anisodus tanguticus TaxID=243964 RepID=A0AAE1QYH0_9SOLA|nr:hypothetical protein RND71_040039 [Anisodus tanguticus]
MEKICSSFRCSIFLIAYISAIFIMTQVLSANAQTVCPYEVYDFACSDAELPRCSSLCHITFGENFVTSECVEKEQVICVCFYKFDKSTCPPPNIY